MPQKIYLRNAETGEELKDHPAHGQTFESFGPYVNGEKGTTDSFTFMEYGKGGPKPSRVFRAEDFDHPVIIRYWNSWDKRLNADRRLK